MLCLEIKWENFPSNFNDISIFDAPKTDSWAPSYQWNIAYTACNCTRMNSSQCIHCMQLYVYEQQPMHTLHAIVRVWTAANAYTARNCTCMNSSQCIHCTQLYVYEQQPMHTLHAIVRVWTAANAYTARNCTTVNAYTARNCTTVNAYTARNCTTVNAYTARNCTCMNSSQCIHCTQYTAKTYCIVYSVYRPGGGGGTN